MIAGMLKYILKGIANAPKRTYKPKTNEKKPIEQ